MSRRRRAGPSSARPRRRARDRGVVRRPEGAASARIGIIKTKWNPKIVDTLADGAKQACLDAGVDADNIFETKVPGAWELPSAARFLALSGRVDAIVCVRAPARCFFRNGGVSTVAGGVPLRQAGGVTTVAAASRRRRGRPVAS